MKKKQKHAKTEYGFTVIELIIVMSVFTILTGIISINLLGSSRSSKLNSTLTTLISDIKTQQIKTMTQDTEGRASSDNYGVYFEENQYTLFHGISYNPLDQSNFIIELDSSLALSNTFASQTLIFSKGSGEINSFIDGQNTITLTNTQDGEEKVISLNSLGVIDSVN